MLIRVIRWGFAALVLVFIWRSVSANWSELRSQSVAWTIRPLPLLSSLALVWVMYACLIEAWRAVLEGWGERLGRLEAARIWIVSSLGKYVPGKVWAIAGMAVMAREAGVAAWAATASAIVLQALAVGTGVIAALAGGLTVLESVRPGLATLFGMGAVVAALGVAMVAWPPVIQRILALTGVPGAGKTPPAGVVAQAALVNLVAWIGYGLAFWLLARGVVPDVRLAPLTAVAAFAASYVAGLIALFAPAGLVVREGLLIALLQGVTGPGAAAVLAVASRILLTIAEVGAAAPFILLRVEKARVG